MKSAFPFNLACFRPPAQCGGRLRRASACLVLALFLGSCTPGDSGPAFEFSLSAMETTFDYTVLAPDRKAARRAVLEAHAEVNRISGLLWEDDPGSEIHQLNRLRTPVMLSVETIAFLQRAEGYSRLTGGAFYLVRTSFRNGDEVGPAPGEEHVSAGTIVFAEDTGLLQGHPGARIVVGGLVRAYAMDRAAAVLREHGVRNGLIRVGPNVVALGTREHRPWEVGIDVADESAEGSEVVELADRAMATVRVDEAIGDGMAGPAQLRSATVLADRAEEAHALAVALLIVGAEGGPELLSCLEGLGGIVVSGEGEVIRIGETGSRTAGGAEEGCALPAFDLSL
jgi:FAD:protein FMN transferase